MDGCCVPGDCEPNNCDRFCQYGFKKDMRGCEICECNKPPVKCTEYKDPNGQVCKKCCDEFGKCWSDCDVPPPPPCKTHTGPDGSKCETCCDPDGFCQTWCDPPPVKCDTFYDSSGAFCTVCCDTLGICKKNCEPVGCPNGGPACKVGTDCPYSSPLAFDCINGCCVPKPIDCNCTKEYAPVCGFDGITYDNACFAKCRSGGVAYTGSCISQKCIETYAACKADGECPSQTTCINGTCCYQ